MSANERANRNGGTEATQKGGDYCPLCAKGQLKPLRVMEDVSYLRFEGCGSILAENNFLERTMAGEARTYGDDYWSEELKAARERGYGA